MLSRFFKSQARIEALLDHPAGPQFQGFAQSLSQTGYSLSTARRHLRAAEHFVYWSYRRGTSLRKLNKQCFTGFVRHLSRCHCPQYGHSKPLPVTHGARLFLTYLRDARIINLPSVEPPRHDPAWLSAFCQWMRRQRGTTDATLNHYSIYLRELLQRLGGEPSRFDAHQLRAFVLEKSRSCGTTVVKKCAVALRMFLRFLIAEGQCAAGLDAAIPVMAQWRLASLPRYLPPKDVERLIASCDRDTAIGRRDRAILLLLARLGLRAGDVTHLRLSDIDWKNASIEVRGKGRHYTRLPLTKEVGEAIVAYLKKDRPPVDTDTVFLRYHPPFCALGSTGISHIVDKAFRSTGIVRPSRGAAHLLRHSFAASMLRQGESLASIATMLRHRSVETTQIYAKVDVSSLQQIAQPWPEV
jgi:integrase/recombinase XerD